MIYTSKQNAVIKEIASLKDKKYRLKLGLYIAEGIKMVNEAIKYGLPIQKIVVTEDSKTSIIDNSFDTIIVSSDVFNYLSSDVTPQGVLAVIKITENNVKSNGNRALILDGVSDPGNMGTIIRTAVAFNYNDLYLINCVDPYSSKCVRSSMSGIYFVNINKCSLKECLSALDGYKIIVADMHGKDLESYIPTNEKLAIVVGNEANGVSKEVKEIANEVLSIKMSDKSESLNVGVATAIMMYKLK
jgi:TrmH family RNA methyltransferase